MTQPELNFEHLLAMSDARGLFEHALGSSARREHGYCVDDVARGLIVMERSRVRSPELRGLVLTYLRFLSHAQGAGGGFVNRCDVLGRWSGPAECADAWGRAIWALGTVTTHDPDPMVRSDALSRYEFSVSRRSPWLHSMLFAALGAAEVLRLIPHHRPSQDLLHAAIDMIPEPAEPSWPWPQPRLTYANAALPEVLIAGGALLGRPSVTDAGLALLTWLLTVEMHADAFSVTAVGGWGPNETRQRFDQQPIELSTITDAVSTAYEITEERQWLATIEAAYGWFDGVNDTQTRMFDPRTGAGYDGLTIHGRNTNQGAESTLAYLMTDQRRLALIGDMRWV